MLLAKIWDWRKALIVAIDPTKIIAFMIESAPDLVTGEGNYPSGGPYTGWRLFRGVEPDNVDDPTVPDTSVSLFIAPPLAPNFRFLLDYPAVQVRVRSSKTDFDAAYVEINAIKSRLLGANAQSILGDWLVSCGVRSDIMSLGMDDQNRIRYVLTVTMITQPAQVTGDNRIPLS